MSPRDEKLWNELVGIRKSLQDLHNTMTDVKVEIATHHQKLESGQAEFRRIYESLKLQNDRMNDHSERIDKNKTAIWNFKFWIFGSFVAALVSIIVFMTGLLQWALDRLVHNG
jgi:hypothetical protein